MADRKSLVSGPENQMLSGLSMLTEDEDKRAQ